ncbi:hypothetical protein [Streptomyces exfoliatus]|uniref:hypothetical protein n=1 Tax=Streptomyces exfoliatus TaxID=1905 RepID=UPI003C2C96F8
MRRGGVEVQVFERAPGLRPGTTAVSLMWNAVLALRPRHRPGARRAQVPHAARSTEGWTDEVPARQFSLRCAPRAEFGIDRPRATVLDACLVADTSMADVPGLAQVSDPRRRTARLAGTGRTRTRRSLPVVRRFQRECAPRSTERVAKLVSGACGLNGRRRLPP